MTSARTTMGLPRGKTIPLSPLRRAMVDMLHASRRVPLVAFERTMPLGDVIAARRRVAVRPSWFAVFIKAYAVVAARNPELRQAFLSWPYARLYQHGGNIAALAVARRVGDEEGVLYFTIRSPEQQSLAAIDAHIRAARTEPVERFSPYRRLLRIGRLPRPVRRLAWWTALEVSGTLRTRFAGTFGVTGVAALGSASLSVLSPLTTTLTYGVFQASGRVVVRLFVDHRVMDGVLPAKALEEVESALCGPIRDELLDSAAPAQAAA